MAQIGFLGLGIMGYPMARHLVNSGHEVSLWSNTAEKATAVESLTQDSIEFCPD